MTNFVPTLREHELLYSAVVRGFRYLQVGEAGPFMRELFGRRWAVASFDLPGGLDALASGLPVSTRDCTVEGWIDDATLLPFHTAFMPAALRHDSRASIRGEVIGLHAKLGLTAFKVRPPERLRFCPQCLSDMEEGGREPWWRRDHQLPGICVCPVHGTALRLSDVAPGGDRHIFVAATRGVCRDEAPSALGEVGHDDLVLLADLARRAASLLSDPPAACAYEDMMVAYRSRLADAGLMRSRRKVDHSALHAAFRDRWGRVTDLIPGMELVDDPERSWLSALVRNGRRAAPALQHVMLTGMLDGMVSAAVDLPFGPGPWSCRNPVADHYGHDVIGDVEIRRDRGMVYGDFACTCGYLFTRSRSADGVIGEPRYRCFGPLFAPALERAVACGESLRATARSLGLDPKTLIREAAIAGIFVPWATQASGVVPASGIAMPATALGLKTKRRRRRLRNWFSIDARLARSVAATVAVIAAEFPPVRVTFAEVERRVARRDWIQKRRDKLPRTAAAMEAAVETTDAFRNRRLDWCVAKALAAGDLRPCEVLRQAGLPMAWLEIVRGRIAIAQLSACPVRLVA